MFFFHIDASYSFTIDTEGSSRQFFFSFTNDKEKKPIKLGDGTFGVVYQTHDVNRELYATKLLYENKALSQIIQTPLSDQVIASFAKRFKRGSDHATIKSLSELKELSKNLGAFSIRLKELVTVDEEFSYLIDQLVGNTRSIAVDRFKQEMLSAEKIRRELHAKGLGSEFAGVIKIVGGTDNFHESLAYQSLISNFKDAQLQVSTYALVMPLYQETLKDLLENGTNKYAIRRSILNKAFPTGGVPENLQEIATEPATLHAYIENHVDLKDEQVIQLKSNVYELVGYDLLGSMGFADRISTILPYLMDVAQGLKALHLAKLSHHDIKPANIFVRLEGKKLDAVVGDLGFLKTQNVLSTTTASTHDALPLGTRHYRSPEQKDYFDICDVKVEHQDVPSSGKKRLTLTVADPKFRDSIIEAGDWLVFSKDTERKRHSVAKIGIEDDVVIISLAGDQDQLMKEVLPDAQTQIVLYKNQAIRTDLFGLGAIVFDMLTCGSSPERFYDNVRGYDREDEDIDALMKLYQQISNYQSSDPGLVHVFSAFKHNQNSEYAPLEIVELILKCMFYKAKNTFFRTLKNPAPVSEEVHGDYKAIDAVLDQLQNLDEHPEYNGARYDNPLQKRIHKPAIQRGSTVLEKEIERLQSLGLDELPLRLARGVWFFKALIQLVRNSIEDKNVFLSEMLPKNIVVKTDSQGNPTSLGFVYSTYKQEEDYKNDLKNDLFHTKITRDILNPYVPNYLASMRRAIRLEPIAGRANTFTYMFPDTSSLSGDNLEGGDWIVIDNDLWVIHTVANGNEITVVADGGSSKELALRSAQDKFIDCIYFSRIDPCVYYFHMLAIYIHHIFFVGINGTTKSKPLVVNIAQGAANLAQSSKVIDLSLTSVKRADAAKKLDPIFQFTTQMYARLAFPDNEKSYYNPSIDNLSCLLPINTDATFLQTMIEDLIEEGHTRLDKLITKVDKAELAKGKILKSFSERLDFNNLLRSIVNISIEKPRFGWW